MSTTTIYPFTTAGNYTASDSNLIEVTGGNATLKDRFDAAETFVATYTTTLNGDRGDGTLTAQTATATLSGGYANFTGSQTLKIPATSNADFTGDYTARFTIKPSWSGAASGNINVFRIGSSVSNNNQTQINIASNLVGLLLYNGSSGLVLNTSVVYTSWVSGQDVEIELDVSASAGTIQLYIDGALVKDTSTTPWSYTSFTGNDYLWFNHSGTAANNFSINDLQVFNEIKHSVAYTGNLSVAPSVVQYDTTSPSLLTNTSITGNINSFTTSESVSGSDTAKYVIQFGGSDYYWTGSAWATSTGVAQSNSASDINSYVAMLDTGNNAVKIKTYLTSNDGTTTPTVDSITITYDASDTSATEPTFCYLEGFLYDFNGPVSGQLIEVRPVLGFANSEIFVSHEWQTFDTTASDGYFSGRIWESASVSKEWEFRIGTKKYRFQVPNATSAKFTDLSITAVTTS